jgi:membrane-bound ClpP family serine protease
MEMRKEKDNVLYYTDGHDVSVTDSVLQVKKKWYHLNGITHHGFLIIPPYRLPGFLTMAVGAILMIVGVTILLPAGLLSEMTIMDRLITTNDVAVVVGAFIFIGGIVMMIMIREKYAVTITTAEGEKHVVVSDRKEYISQIVHALNEAFFARVSPSISKQDKREFKVSGR